MGRGNVANRGHGVGGLRRLAAGFGRTGGAIGGVSTLAQTMAPVPLTSEGGPPTMSER